MTDNTRITDLTASYIRLLGDSAIADYDRLIAHAIAMARYNATLKRTQSPTIANEISKRAHRDCYRNGRDRVDPIRINTIIKDALR